MLSLPKLSGTVQFYGFSKEETIASSVVFKEVGFYLSYNLNYNHPLISHTLPQCPVIKHTISVINVIKSTYIDVDSRHSIEF